MEAVYVATSLKCAWRATLRLHATAAPRSTKLTHDEELLDPSYNAGIVRYRRKGRDLLVFTKRRAPNART